LGFLKTSLALFFVRAAERTSSVSGMARASRLMNLSTIALIFALSILPAPTRGAPFDFEQWLNDELPRPGSTLKDKLKCYTLPFGAIGFVSHLLT
jgi:hypothetical protein